MITLGDICVLSAQMKSRWWQAYMDGLLDDDCFVRLVGYTDHMRGLAVEWAIYVDSLPDVESMAAVMLSA